MIEVQEVKVCKEVKEVFDLIEAVAVDIKAKKTAAEIASDVLPKFIAALEGVNLISEELKDDAIYDTAALAIASLAKKLKA